MIPTLNETKLTFKNIVNCVFDNKYKDVPTTQILEIFHKNSNELLKRWIDSKETDFSVYSDKKYCDDLLICYYYVSKGSIVGALKWFEKNGVDISKLTCFEDYNGLGATTLHLIKSDFKTVCCFNDVKSQCAIACKLNDEFLIGSGKFSLHIKHRKDIPKTDVIFTLETVEHFKEPLKYIKELTSKLNPNGYLIYGAGFKNMYPGHFTNYTCDGVEYSRAKISRLCKKYLREKFDLIYSGFNGKPTIYQLH